MYDLFLYRRCSRKLNEPIIFITLQSVIFFDEDAIFISLVYTHVIIIMFVKSLRICFLIFLKSAFNRLSFVCFNFLIMRKIPPSMYIFIFYILLVFRYFILSLTFLLYYLVFVILSAKYFIDLTNVKVLYIIILYIFK